MMMALSVVPAFGDVSPVVVVDEFKAGDAYSAVGSPRSAADGPNPASYVSPQEVDASLDPMHALDYDANLVPTNQLVIGVPRGEIEDWIDEGSSLTDIEIRPVTPGLDGFALVNPSGEVVFSNMSSSMDGRVLFRYIVLMDGLWQVRLHPVAGGPGVPIVTFGPPSSSIQPDSAKRLIANTVNDLTAQHLAG
jgi:hypothetical protein